MIAALFSVIGVILCWIITLKIVNHENETIFDIPTYIIDED